MQQLIAKQKAAQNAAMAASKPGFLGGAGAFGGGAGLYGAGATGSSQLSKPAGGGFAYGAASAGGSLFGAASAAQGGNSFQAGLGSVGKMGGLTAGTTGIGSFGSMGTSKPSTAAGGFTYGAASSFGGPGSLFGAASKAAPGAGVGGDQYEIPLDLTKVQNKQKPTKTYEEQTAEEKAKGGIVGKTT